MGKNKKLRPAGDVLLDLEPLLFELVQDHSLQCGDVLALINVWIQTHYPAAIEEYTAGGSPQMFYGQMSQNKKV